MKKQVLSLLLVLAMVIAMVPAAFAAEDWESDMDVLGVAVKDGVYYDSVQAAVNAEGNNVITLLQDSQEAVTASGDLYLDLNGNTLASLTIDGTLYGMDSASNNYTASGAKIGTVNGQYASNYRHTDAKRYLAIKEDTGISFHRFYMGITKVSLAPTVTGFGYKAEFYGDEAVQAQIASIGYTLWVTEGKEVTRSCDFKNLLTLRLKNYDVAGYGETAVNAKVFVTLTDGSTIDSLPTAYSMRQVVEQINTDFAKYESAQKAAVQTMCNAYTTAMTGWEIANILTWTE